MPSDSLDQSNNLQTQNRAKVRRRGRRRRAGAGALGSLVLLPEKRVAAGMLCLSCALMVFQLLYLSSFRGLYEDMYIGQTSEELIYGLGAPKTVLGKPEDGEWVYERAGNSLSATLSAGKSALIKCRMVSVSCTPPLDLPSGVSEFDIWARWGAPTSVSYPQGRKTLFYQPLGVTLELARYRVADVTVQASNGFPLGAGLWIYTP